MADYENPWVYNGKFFTTDDIHDSFGFVYKITNLIDGRIYVGKKLFTRAKTRQIKGKKKRERVASDWQTYYSSSEKLNEDVASQGKENFRREILRVCRNRAECSYWEAHYQFELGVLIREDSYNEWMSVKVRKSHLITKTGLRSRGSSTPSRGTKKATATAQSRTKAKTSPI